MDKELWFDLTTLNLDKTPYIAYILNWGYGGVFIDEKCFDILSLIPKELKIVFDCKCSDPDKFELPKELSDRKIIVASDNSKVLECVKKKNIPTCFMIKVVNKETMDRAIEFSQYNSYVLIEFEDTTNIPLELIVAFSQHNKSKVFKCVKNSNDGWIATMTMEEGSFGVLLSTNSYDTIRKLSEHVSDNCSKDIKLQELTVMGISHVGMGDRVCIDTISKLRSNEGMLIGSTSTGGILVSSENHFLPYMNLRPFRVNAGAIHSYIFCDNNETKYLSELKAGDNVLIVDTDGKTRVTAVGRIKMERRPMLLIECMDLKKKSVNVIVQDDWHIRLLSNKNKVCNATELKEGDVLLGITCESGRHLGVKISETIMEK